MMTFIIRIVALTWVLLTLGSAQAVTPRFKSEAETIYNIGATIQLPHNQATKLGSINLRLETGNPNRFSNFSFESQDLTGWTKNETSGTITDSYNTTQSVDGQYELAASFTGAVGNIEQLQTMNVSTLDGKKGIVSIWLRTGTVGFEVCSVIDNVEIDCVLVSTDNVFAPYTFPITFGSTNYGIRVKAASSTTATINFDNAFIGLEYPKIPAEEQCNGYIKECNAERLFSSWSLYNDGAVDTAIDGTGGVANSTFSRTTTSNIRGDGSFEFHKDGANRIGEGVSYDFEIDTADKAEKLYISFDFAGDSQFLDDFLKVQIYDVTNAKIIPVNGEDIKAGTKSYLGWFQSSPDSVNYRLILHIQDTTTNGFSIYFDQVVVEKRSASYGMAATDWKAYTPTFTGLGTVTNAVGYWRQVGDSAEYKVSVTSGTVAATLFSISLEPSHSIDSAKLPISANTSAAAGSTVGMAGSAYGGGEFHVVTAPGTSNSLVYAGDVSINNNANTLIPRNGNGNHISSTASSYRFTVPIQGWSTNTVQSEDIGNRNVVVEGRDNGGTSITAIVTPVDFTETKDLTASWDGTVFTAPESGEYDFVGSIRLTAVAPDFAVYSYIDKNDGSGYTISKTGGYSISAAILLPFKLTENLEKGWKVQLRLNVSRTLGVGIGQQHNLHISKKAQPQTILETATVAARYTSNSGQSIANATAGETIEFEDLVEDTHNAYDTTTGVYTVPVSGNYAISALFCMTSLSGDTGEFRPRVEVNGTLIYDMRNYHNLGSLEGLVIAIASTPLVKDDLVEIQLYHTHGGTKSLTTTSENNTFSIKRNK